MRNGSSPFSGKLRLDFSAFLSIAILQAERLERRIKMEQEKEKRNRQQKYLTVMALMKEMRSGGIIDKDDLLIVEAVFAEQFKPIWRYKDFEL